jgi:DNA modification methylase
MKPVIIGDAVLHLGDCIEVMRTMGDNSVDSIVCDPPYELTSARPGGRSPATEGKVMKGFMGMAWDGSGIAYSVEMWTEALRVLKPGGHLLAFSGSRTYHRMTCAIEDAGFEVRDQIMWVYGSGFPKSLDVSKAIDKVAPRLDMLEKRYDLAEHIRACRTAAGLSAVAVNAWFGYASGVQHWESKNQSGHRFPSVADWAVLRDRLGVSDEWAPLIERVEAERDVVGQRTTGIGTGGGTVAIMGDGSRDITAPATDAARQWKGWGTALKPAHEPICVARKPLIGTVAANVLVHGTGGLNIDGCRVPTDDALGGGAQKSVAVDGKGEGWQRPWMHDADAVAAHAERVNANVARAETLGRWPANLIHDGSDEVLAAFPDSNGSGAARMLKRGARDGEGWGMADEPGALRDAGTGSAARFFYCAKTSKGDRNAGTEQLPQKQGGMVSNTSGQHMTRRDEGYQAPLTGNNHPTVKPTDLMAYLVRLVTPPGGLVLDPFMGSGSTGKACMREGFKFVGIDMTPEYVEISSARIAAELVKPLQKEMFA